MSALETLVKEIYMDAREKDPMRYALAMGVWLLVSEWEAIAFSPVEKTELYQKIEGLITWAKMKEQSK